MQGRPFFCRNNHFTHGGHNGNRRQTDAIQLNKIPEIPIDCPLMSARVTKVALHCKTITYFSGF